MTKKNNRKLINLFSHFKWTYLVIALSLTLPAQAQLSEGNNSSERFFRQGQRQLEKDIRVIEQNTQSEEPSGENNNPSVLTVEPEIKDEKNTEIEPNPTETEVTPDSSLENDPNSTETDINADTIPESDDSSEIEPNPTETEVTPDSSEIKIKPETDVMPNPSENKLETN